MEVGSGADVVQEMKIQAKYQDRQCHTEPW